jgi:hypothetical protein
MGMITKVNMGIRKINGNINNHGNHDAIVTIGSRSAPKGRGCHAAVPPNRNLKITDFLNIMISNFYVIYPPAEISHSNRLMTSTLGF